MRKYAFVGKWVSSQPFDSDDYLVEYNIKKSGGSYRVTAKDYRDGEAMKVSDVKFDGQTLEFASLMPSTGRSGINRFRVKSQDEVVSEFTFTVVETLTRIPVRELPVVKPKPKTKTATMRRRKA